VYVWFFVGQVTGRLAQKGGGVFSRILILVEGRTTRSFLVLNKKIMALTDTFS